MDSYPISTMRYDDILKLVLIRKLIELRVPHRAIEQCLQALDEAEVEIEQRDRAEVEIAEQFAIKWNG